MTRANFSLAAGIAAFSIFIGVSALYAADGVRVRGTISAYQASTLTVKTREGGTVEIRLAPDWKVSSVAKASLGDIKEGDFLGIASAPDSKGNAGALEVVIFPAAMKGAGEGDRPWDLEPDSSMTNATVSQMVTGTDGPVVTLSYEGGEKKITIPANVPIVTFAPATAADLKPGATVFVPADKAADGTYTSERVVVETNGVAPPM